MMLTRLTGVLLGAAVALSAGVSSERLCRMDSGRKVNCTATTLSDIQRLHCSRCHTKLSYIFAFEAASNDQRPADVCRTFINDYGNSHQPHYSDDLKDCFGPGVKFLDGALECQVAYGWKVAPCIESPVNFYECACNHGFNDDNIKKMAPCFRAEKQLPSINDKCPAKTNQQKRYRAPTNSGKVAANPRLRLPANGRTGGGRGGRGGRGAALVVRDAVAAADDVSDDNPSDEVPADDGSNDNPSDEVPADDSGNGSTDDWGYDQDSTFVDDWPPNLEDQFSPVLNDTDDIAFYLDVYERVVLVDATTLEVIYYEPYYLETAPSFDQLIPIPDETDYQVVRRCWFYPFSEDTVWCFQWYISEDEFSDYDYAKDGKDIPTATASGADNGIKSTEGATAAPTTYSSTSYETAGSAPPRTTRTVTAEAVTATATSGPSTAGGPAATAKGSGPASTQSASSSASARPNIWQSWFGGVPCLAVLYHVLG